MMSIIVAMLGIDVTWMKTLALPKVSCTLQQTAWFMLSSTPLQAETECFFKNFVLFRKSFKQMLLTLYIDSILYSLCDIFLLFAHENTLACDTIYQLDREIVEYLLFRSSRLFLQKTAWNVFAKVVGELSNELCGNIYTPQGVEPNILEPLNGLLYGVNALALIDIWELWIAF